MNLVDNLKILLGTSVAFKIKAQNYHWNISGPDFIQYHKFLNKIYSSVEDSIDGIAEHIRALGSYAPGSMKRFLELSRLVEEEVIPESKEMFKRLAKDNLFLHEILLEVHEAAEQEKRFGTINFIEGLLDSNEKTQWMLDSVAK